MHVGFLSKHSPNGWYRVIGPVRAVHHLGHQVTLVERDPRGGFDLKPLLRCDVVHFFRTAERPVQAAVERLRSHGVAVTWDNDNDVRLRPDGTTMATIMSHRAAHDAFNNERRMIRRADVVTTTSRYLAKLYGTVTDAPVVQIENYLTAEQYARGPRPDHDGVVIGWIAGNEHVADERNLKLSRTVSEVLERHPEVRVVTIGVRLAIDSPRYTYHRRSEFADLKEHTRHFDIGIAPLSDIPMSYARSNIKVKEYAAAGVPWLASLRGPYEGLGPDEGGMLVRDEDWGRALSVLIESDALRAKLRQRAVVWAEGQAVERHARKWAQAFEQAVSLAADRRAAGGAVSPRSARAGA